MPPRTLHYDRVARALHWTIGSLVIVNILLGITHDALRGVFQAMFWHQSIGLTVLALSLVRLGWRLSHPAAPLPEGTAAWEKAAAIGTHWIFYTLMIFMPLSGWIFTSAGKWPIPFFGLFEVPKFAVTKADPIVGTLHESHETLGWIWGALVLLHIAAALRHHFILKDGVLLRMWRDAPER